ncbi:Adaptive-response sensory-kinase SasA [bioreactor metagenome]|uniref:histidine kinase n=1 Tax=bioreactor metagenome TaxID=1076179 RepID=A0A645B8S7_9ZZZZ|nr:HAMP domain-containing sensor histidine kinase [Christensenella sp.]
MNCDKKSSFHRFGLPIIFSIIVFAILLITSIIIVLVTLLLVRMNAINIVKISRHEPLLPVFMLLIISVLVGTIVSLVISRIPLKPVRQVIDATNRLAAGDFSARLRLPGARVFSELAVSFNRMAEELGGIEMLRSDFVDNFSHEFKTPIVSIKGFAEELKHDDLTQEQRNEYLDIIISESTRLAALATNVLNLSRVEKQAILTNRLRFDLTEQIRRCILLFENKWEQRRLSLNVELEEISLFGDEELLNQVWLNLIDNAVKFTPEGGSIEIRLNRSDPAAVFSIRDDGYGISAEAQKHIFDKFYQGDASRTSAGNGLGLSLAKRIVSLHGGSIQCESEEGVGTMFSVSLPLS